MAFLILIGAAAFLLLIFLSAAIKVAREYERGVVFRLGKLLDQPKGPGVIFVFAPLDKMVRVSLRTIVMDVPPQDIITRDNVSVKVNAVVYFRVMDPRKAIVEVESYHYATSQLAQTTLRSVLGQVELDDLLSEREKRAKIVHAAGELEASQKLAQAATAMAVEPMTITLRYLQTLTEIASEKNSTIIFPLPIELLNLLKPGK